MSLESNSLKNYKRLVSWSLKEFSHLPWRKERSLYRTLVSEIMLQQTTVSTVLNHFERFIKQYPTPQDIAKASEEQLLISWKGLGYYRRARNLQKACKTITEKYNGVIPLEFEKLIEINGIGIYTANAILAMGANKRALAIDANLERIISRLYGIKELKGPKLQKEILKQFANKQVAKEIAPIGARDFNESLMDLGRNFCQARRTSCDLCPLRTNCYAFKNNEVDSLPFAIDKKKESFELELLRVILKKGDKYLAYKKSKIHWLSGQYEIPTFILSSEDSKLEQYPRFNLDIDFSLLPIIKTSITKYKIINRILWVDEKEFKELGLNLDDYELISENLSTASVKALNL